VVRPTELSLGGPNYYETQAPLVSTWESNAQQQAGLQFQKDIVTARQTMVQNRQQMELEGSQAQTQLALGDYMRSQSAEKAGWTGGYMLDQKRQGDYLRASIQAQMYGAQELQRYGMETQLEAARLAFDLGKEQLAYQLYQQEQQKAITEAQMFGYYISPEIKDMFNQLRTANSVVADTNATEAERQRAQSVIAQINAWFGEENLDPNDIMKFAEVTMEREQWNQAKLDAVLATINDDPSIFLQRNADGTYVIDPVNGQYIKLNFDDINSEDLGLFLSKDDNSNNKFADAAFRSYAKFLAQTTINDFFNSLGEGVVPTAEAFRNFLAVEGADKLKAFRDKNPSLKGIIDAILAENFNPSLTRNGITLQYNSTSGSDSSENTNEEIEEEIEVDEENPWDILTDYKNPVTNEVMTWEDYTTKYNSFYTATGGTKATAPQMATMYKEDYDFFISTSESRFNNLNFTDWAGRLQRSHNTFSNKSYKDYVFESVVAFIEKQTGAKDAQVSFNVLNTRNKENISIPLSNVTPSMESKLLALGFKKTNNEYLLNYEIAGLVTSNTNNLLNYKVPVYKDGSGWRDRYERNMNANGILRLFYFMNDKNKNFTYTNEGESRW
jgi:hypothetical protein